MKPRKADIQEKEEIINFLNNFANLPDRIALLEGGFCGLPALIRERQFRFYTKLVNNRSHMTDDPFMHMLSIARENSSPSARYMTVFLKPLMCHLSRVILRPGKNM